MSSILVLGAYGLLGCSLSNYLKEANYTILRQGRDQSADISLNPLNPDELTHIFQREQIDFIINLIALTNVDECERHCTLAYEAHVKILEVLEYSIKDMPVKPHLIHISTDHVYDGWGPHIEALTAPCNVYALSKFAGELVAKNMGATILRTNFFGRSYCGTRQSFSDWVISSLEAGKQITVFDDVYISALHIQTLCSAIDLVIRNPHPGIFNLGSLDGNTKAYVALMLAQRLGLDHHLLSIGTVKGANFYARRPFDMRMDSSEFGKRFNFLSPTFESQINLAVQEYIDANHT